MKCIANLILVTIFSTVAVLARKPPPLKITTYWEGDFRYQLYGDGTAVLLNTPMGYLLDSTIPATIYYQNHEFHVTEIAENAFYDKEVEKLTIDSKNTGLIIRKNAFYGIRNFKEFVINSSSVTAEIDAFNNIGSKVDVYGAGVPNFAEKYISKLLKQWGLPVGNNYNSVDDYTKMRNLFTLGKNFQRTFNIYDKASSPNNAASVLITGAGSRNGLTRLYRIFAMTMGISNEEILAGCDDIHYCWNYVKVNIDEGKKWYVFDINDRIGDNTTWNLSAFKKESKFVSNTLKSFYGSSMNINPHNFIIHNNRYNYRYESKYDYLNSENFDSYLKRTNGGQRTL
jgi:hypothetical protein